jgi:prepilin-type processing-associated H-X9-DG protein/prepilin-type N-terminal cleavage/methylation domain-containing protein
MRRRSAFTLIEVLFVVGIIAVLISLLLPAIQSSREMARRVQCGNNMLQLGIALGNYASSHRVFPPGVVNDKGPILNLPAGYHYSWIVQILPYTEHRSVYSHFNFRESVYEPSNETTSNSVIQTLLCPSDGMRSVAGTSYAGCHHDVDAPIAADNTGILYLNSRVNYDDITDGPAYTIMLGEMRRDGPTMGWASGTRATLRNTGYPIDEPDAHAPPRGSTYLSQAGSSRSNDPNIVANMVEDGILPVDYVGGFSSWHPSGSNFLFADGSVRLLKQTIDQHIYRFLGNRADGNLISDDAY